MILGLIAVSVIAAGFLFLRYYPHRRAVLIEGVFDKAEKTTELFKNTRLITYWFDNYCRECMEKEKPNPLYGQCHQSIPSSAVQLVNSYQPQQGDPIRIVVWKNIFGKVIAYRIERTNFAEEFGPRQLEQEEQEWRAYEEARDRRKALDLGMIVSELRAKREEDNIRYAMERLGMSRGQVIAAGYHTLPNSRILDISRAKALSEKTGTTVTEEDVRREEKKFMDEVLVRSYDAPFCGWEADLTLRYHHDYEYAETGTVAKTEVGDTEWVLHHIKTCPVCFPKFNKMRERFLSSPRTQECLTDENIAEIVRTGMLGGKKELDWHGCLRCHVLFIRRQEEYLKVPSGPECFTQADLHGIHTTGEIPEDWRAHLAQCLRCQYASRRHRDMWLDRVAPQPDIPRFRLKNIRKNLKKTQ
ncbi:MAG: hypothetical protein A2939_04675 [Parcubacteria group bacterium RIFCSPLOWO2_01_FULL_48_18]|nr:MAG: hypothetical protein A2939_04675 [Parcubacteria group bacterium RIFCSPLOWO2_01_FULL_48_18]